MLFGFGGARVLPALRKIGLCKGALDARPGALRGRLDCGVGVAVGKRDGNRRGRMGFCKDFPASLTALYGLLGLGAGTLGIIRSRGEPGSQKLDLVPRNLRICSHHGDCPGLNVIEGILH